MKMPGELTTVNNCAIVILAAGGSKRLGKPKQLLNYKNEVLLQRAINASSGSSVQSIVLVLGAAFEAIINEIDTKGLHVIKNEEWQKGIASSISMGINALHEIKSLPDAVILMVCDQPFINSSILDELIATQKSTGKPIICSTYENTIGIPALFYKDFFQQLLEMEGDTGAKKIMQQYPDLLAKVPFPLGNIDIDTLDDYEALTE